MQEIVGVENWNNILINNVKLLVCFSAKWCGPCKTLKPKLELLVNDDRYKNIGFYTVDVDKNEELSKLLNITSLPTIIIISFGREYKRIVGSNYTQIVEDLHALQQKKIK